jgi:hypothetical protein
VLLAAVLLAFGSAISFRLTYDSVAIVGMDRRIADNRPAALLTGDWWDREVSDEGLEVRPSLWRPLTKLWFWMLHPRDGRLRGPGDAVPLVMVGAVLLQVLVALLRFEIILRLLPASRDGPWIAAVATGLSVLHPLNAEVVGTAVGSADALATLFSSLAVLLALVRKPLWDHYAILMATFLALTAKESAIVTPLFVGVAAALVPPVSSKRVMLCSLASGLGAVLFLLVRRQVLGEFLGVGDPVFALFAPSERIATALAVVARFDLPALLWPTSIHPNLGLVDIPPASFSDAPVLAGIGLLLALVLSAVWLWRRGRALAASGLILFAAGLLPVSNLFFSIGAMGAARFFHLPLLGLALVAADLVSWPAQRTRTALLGAVLCGVLLLLTRMELAKWESNEKLFTRMTVEQAQCPVGYYNLGVLEQERARPNLARALELFLAASAIELPRIPERDVIQEDLLELRFQAAMNAGGLATMRSQTEPAFLGTAERQFALALAVSAEGLKSAAFGAEDTNWVFLRAEALCSAARTAYMRERSSAQSRAIAMLNEARLMVPDHSASDLCEAWIAEAEGGMTQALALSARVVERTRPQWKQARARNEARDHAQRLQRAGRSEAAADLNLDVALAGAGAEDPTLLFEAARSAASFRLAGMKPRVVAAWRLFLNHAAPTDVQRREHAAQELRRLGGA